jgi:hypothetical protein
MANPFQLNPDESILYRSQRLQKWYSLAWRIGVELFEVAVFILFSFIALTSLGGAILMKLLPVYVADVVSRIIFQGIAPLLIIAWFVEDTARIFTSEFILTNQRIWTKGSPYAWTPGHETLLGDIRYLSQRREALFIHLKSAKKTQVHVFPDSKEIVKAYTQFTGKSETN